MWYKEKEIQALIKLSAAAFLLLSGYAFTRSASNAVFKGAYGAENLPFVMMLSVVGVFLTVWIYGRILSAFGPKKTLAVTTLGSGLLILLAVGLIHFGFKWATGLMYILKEAYIVLIIEQYWSLLNSSFTKEKARRFYGVVLGFSSAGGIVGNFSSAALVEHYGSLVMIAIGAILTIAATWYSHKSFDRVANRHENYMRHSDHMGLRIFKEEPAVLGIFTLILLTQVLSFSLELSWHHQMQAALGSVEFQNRYENLFWGRIDMMTLVLNFIISPWLLPRVSFQKIHYAIPIIHVVAISNLIINPSLLSATTAFFLFKAFDYSIFRSVKEILYIPFSFDIRYRAKEVIDVFGYRFGKGAVSGVVTGLQGFGLLLSAQFSWIALGAALVWFPTIKNVLSRYFAKAAKSPLQE